MMEEISHITECCICAEMFSEPRMLPCIHTFCLKCLEATRSKSEKNPGDTMPCPICRQQFTIPPSGISSLQKNFFMERLVEVAKISKPLEHTVSCDVCLISKSSGDSEVHDASKYCIECRENMCEFCSIQHIRQKPSRDHQIVPFGSQLKDENVLKIKKFLATYCNRHYKDELRMYCADCKKVICMMCFAECHKMHNCFDVDKVAESFRDEIGRFLQKVSEVSKEGTQRKLNMENEKRNFMEELDMAEGALRDRANELKQFIDMHTKILLDELVQRKAVRVKETEQKTEEIEMYLSIVGSFIGYCNEIISQGTPTDICCCVNDLRARADELIEVNARQIEEDTSIGRVFFKASEMEDFLTVDNIVGSLEEENKFFPTDWANNVQPDFTERYHEIGDSFNALCNEVEAKGTPEYIRHFVHDLRIRADVLQEAIAKQIKQDSSAVQVSSKTFTIQKNPNVEKILGSLERQHMVPRGIKAQKEKPVSAKFITRIKCPIDVQAVTKMDDRIYVLSRRSTSVFEKATAICIFHDDIPCRRLQYIKALEILCVHDVAASDTLKCLFISDSKSRCIWKLTVNDGRLTQWLQLLTLVSMSMSNEGNVLLLRDDEGTSRLEIYGSDAKIIQCISLSHVVASPLVVVQASNGLYVIIHKSNGSFSATWVLSELNSKGQVLRQLRSREKWNPYHMALDSGNNRLFVNLWDGVRFRVVICDIGSFEWKETIVLSDDRFLPPFYDERKKHLFVGRPNTVYVYQMR